MAYKQQSSSLFLNYCERKKEQKQNSLELNVCVNWVESKERHRIRDNPLINIAITVKVWLWPPTILFFWCTKVERKQLKLNKACAIDIRSNHRLFNEPCQSVCVWLPTLLYSLEPWLTNVWIRKPSKVDCTEMCVSHIAVNTVITCFCTDTNFKRYRCWYHDRTWSNLDTNHWTMSTKYLHMWHKYDLQMSTLSKDIRTACSKIINYNSTTKSITGMQIFSASKTGFQIIMSVFIHFYKLSVILLEQEIVSGSGISWAYANLQLTPDR